MTQDKREVYKLRSQLEKYFKRQAEHLIGESEAASAITTNKHSFGLAGEAALRAFLTNHLPERYGIGTGFVVSYDESSAQVDIILFDVLDCFKIPITETEAIFSVEGVYGVVEVKSSPNRNSSSKGVIEKAVKNILSVKSLDTPIFYLTEGNTVPAFTRMTDSKILSERKYITFNCPVGAILVLCCRDSFETVASHFRKKSEELEHCPDLLCVLDREHFGLCGFDHNEGTPKDITRFWKEPCDSPGETLSKFIYWLMHKITFEHFTQRPTFFRDDYKALWPSAMAPVVPRIRVDVSSSGTERSLPWNNDTRVFED